MTTMTLHDAPTWRAVAQQQLRATAIEMRRAGAVLFACLIGIVLASVFVAARNAMLSPDHFGFTLDPTMTIPVGLFGLFAAGGVWQREEPSRRAYHLAMPMPRVTHTWLRVGAGWIWLMASALVYLALLVILGWAVAMIGHGQLTSHVAWWAWIAPFAAATMVYLLTSVAMVAAEQPLIWIFAAPFALVVLLALPGIYQWQAGTRLTNQLLRSAFSPTFISWPILETVKQTAARAPWVNVDWRRSLLGVLFWTAAGIAGIWLAARRRPRNVK